MKFERLTTIEHPMFQKAMELYCTSFPFHEQREATSQQQIMGCREYQFNLIYDENIFIGLVLCWETTEFIYIEHFCIMPGLRNQKYGQRALELLCQRGKPVILEIDPPLDETSLRRKGFYQRLGFQENSYEHIHPAYHADCSGHRLVVMSRPDLIADSLYHKFVQYLESVVMK